MDWMDFGKDVAKTGMYGSPLFSTLFGGGNNYQNPSRAAMPFLNQIQGATQPYYQPYINAGTEELPKLTEQFNQLMSDPAAMMKMFGSSYQQSPGYQFQMNQGERAINNAAAAGGMSGSPMHQAGAANYASNLANQDYYNYMNHVMNLYGSGLAGGTDIEHQGYGAGTGFADILANILSGKANYAFTGAAGENQARSQDESNIFSGLGAIATHLL